MEFGKRVSVREHLRTFKSEGGKKKNAFHTIVIEKKNLRYDLSSVQSLLANRRQHSSA